jgi:hypothetical protein
MSLALVFAMPFLAASLVAQSSSAPASGPVSVPANGAKILGDAAYTEILAKGKVVRIGSSPEMLPAHPAAEGLGAAVSAEKSGVVVESAFFLPRASVADSAKVKAELAAIYGTMRSFGSMQGIEYYSASRKAMRTLYVESYRIDDESKRARLPDEAFPAPDAVPASETVLAFQKDLSLGSNVYRYTFTSYPDAVLVEATNLTRMSYGLVPAVSQGGFKTRVLVVQASDGIVFYMLSAAKVPGFLKSKLGESLANRAEALFRWFSSKSSGL